MTISTHDIESQAAAQPLLPQELPDRTHGKKTEHHEGTNEVQPRIGEIPSVRKPGYGNWVWAEQQCARRCGFSVAEAKLVQEAYELYQKRGDPKTFIIKAFWGIEFPADIVKLFTKPVLSQEELVKMVQKAHRQGGTLAKAQDMAEAARTYISPYADVAWAGIRLIFSTAFGSGFKDAYEDRRHLIETFAELFAITMECFQPGGNLQPNSVQEAGHEQLDKDKQISSPITSTALPATTLIREVSLVAVPEDDLRYAPITSIDDTTVDSPAQHPKSSMKTMKDLFPDIASGIEAGRFDCSKLDEGKFRRVIQRLLSSRSQGQGPGDTSRNEFVADYIIVGWFPGGSLDPRERLMRLKSDTDLFKQMRKGIRSVRGWRRAFSLKSLHTFGLYKCDISRGAHLQMELNDEEKSILSHFMVAYKASLRRHDKDVARAWTEWVRRELNANQVILFEGRYSLQLIYSWSAVRLSIAVVTPTVFSLAVGLGYMIKTGDVSTAWTISSYIVTAAGAIVALLGILGALKDS